MPTPAVIERMRDLHAKLAETPDAYSPANRSQATAIRQQLETIMLDPTDVQLYMSLNDRLLLAYVGFEIDHPKLAAAMVEAQKSLLAAGL